MTAVPKGVGAGQKDLENAIAKGGKAQSRFVPVHHVACQKDGYGGGRPFAVEPSVLGLVESKIFMPVGKVAQLASGAHQFALFLRVVIHAKLNICLKRQQIRIVLEYFVPHRDLLSEFGVHLLCLLYCIFTSLSTANFETFWQIYKESCICRPFVVD